jgi:8-amino-7-oxononanoate synthase
MKAKLEARKKQNIFRTLPQKVIGIDFASNDYLGIIHSNCLAKPIQKYLGSSCGYGATGARLLTGNSKQLEMLERKIADFHGFEEALIFSCGFMANFGLISCLIDRDDILIYDTEIHASTHDGLKRIQGKAYPFRHNDVSHLEKRLQAACNKGRRFIAIESIYSTDGSLAPILEIYKLAEQYRADIIVDEAHAVGIFGADGRGYAPPHDRVCAKVVTFGKALGTFGAAILGSKLLKEYLINFAIPFIYTTALPPYVIASISASYDIFPTLSKERSKLCTLIQHFKTVFSTASNSPIQCVLLPQLHKVVKDLQESNFTVRALLRPTVAKEKECLRVCLHAYNSIEEINQLRAALQ